MFGETSKEATFLELTAEVKEIPIKVDFCYTYTWDYPEELNIELEDFFTLIVADGHVFLWENKRT